MPVVSRGTEYALNEDTNLEVQVSLRKDNAPERNGERKGRRKFFTKEKAIQTETGNVDLIGAHKQRTIAY